MNRRDSGRRGRRPDLIEREVSTDDEAALRAAPVTAIEERDRSVVVRLAGELDLWNSDAVRGALREGAARQPRRLVVDLANVAFVDSTTLGALLEARAAVGDATSLRLAAPAFAVRRTLDVSGLTQHFAVFESVDAALAD